MRAHTCAVAIIFSFIILSSTFAPPASASRIAFEGDLRITGGETGCLRNTPSMATDGRGGVYVAWHERAEEDFRVSYTFSRDSGQTWSGCRMIPDSGFPVQADPTLSLDSAGVVHFVWLSFVRGSAESAIRTCASADGGVSLGPITTVSDNDSFVMVDRPRCLADRRDGRLHVTYSQWASSVKVKTVSMAAEGTEAAPCRDVCKNPRGVWPVLGQDSDGRVYVCWLSWNERAYEIRVAQTMRPERGFRAPRVVSEMSFAFRPGLWAFGYPTMAAGAPGRVYVAWCDDRRQSGDWDLMFSLSTNYGDTFSEPAYIHRGTEPGELSILPAMAVDPYGRIHVAWYHFRPGEGVWEILHSSSEDGGLTFSTPALVSDSSFEGGAYLGDFLSVACDWNFVYVAWSDNRTGDSDIYINRAKILPRGRLGVGPVVRTVF